MLLQNFMDHILIAVRVFPQSKINTVEKVFWDGYNLSLTVRVTVVPEQNKANDAVVKLLSKKFKLSKSSFKLMRGNRCRNKIFRVSNIDESFFKKVKDL